MKRIIHVAQDAIRRNREKGTNDPPLIVRTYKGAKRAHTLEIMGDDGKVIARFVHSPHKPLSCGARLWLETEQEVRINNEYQPEEENACGLLPT